MKRICENGAFLIQGEYYLYNNLWGARTGSGSQCLWLSAFDQAHIAWGTSWNWIGQENTIKSFAAVVWGWHWGWKTTHTVLPIQLSAIRSLRSTWRFNITHPRVGGTNVTYDIWLSENPDPGEENPTGEVMVWLYHTGDIRPIGSRQTDLVIDGVEWHLWEGPHPVSGWPVYSFIRTVNTETDTLDLTNFFQYLNLVRLNKAVYLLSVEAGAEIFTGEGRLETTYYSLDLEAR
jgi:hypothetical protein